MDASGAKLFIRHGSEQRQEYDLTGETVVLGREAMNDVILHDPEVSRRHAQIAFQGGRYIIEDLGSTNGTFVNERRITVPTPLKNGDIVEMGESLSIIFQSTQATMDETVIKPEPALDADKTVADADALPGWPAVGEPQYETPIPGVANYPTTPPAAATGTYTGPQESLPPPPQAKKGNRNRYFIGCGCLFILIVVACAASLFLVDALAPNLLYCDLGGPIFDTLGFSMDCP